METLQDFISDIETALPHGQDAVEKSLKAALARWDGPPPWLGAPERGDFSILHQAPGLTIMNVVWPSGLVTEPHNHNMWATIGVYQGREDNVLWQRDGDDITPVGAVSLGQGEACSLAEDAIHTAFNPTPGLTGTIHIYGGDFMSGEKSEWDPVTHQERPRHMAAKVSNWSPDA